MSIQDKNLEKKIKQILKIKKIMNIKKEVDEALNRKLKEKKKTFYGAIRT
jgi:hypothetical protein